MPVYRVFCTRHYIDVIFLDVEADNPKLAEKAALETACVLVPDSRARATDNNWHPDTAAELPAIGYSSKTMQMKEVRTARNGSKVYASSYELEKINKEKNNANTKD